MKYFGGIIAAVLGIILPLNRAFGEIPIPVNHPVTGQLAGLQNEEQVWLCPTDTNIIIANHRDFRLGYRQIGLARSVDNGSTWTDTLISPEYQIFSYQSDPVMTVNSAGDIIIGHLDYNSISGGASHLAHLVSHDGGETWNGPYTVSPVTGPYFEDKQFITCDRTGGPYDGNIYISWTRFPNPDRIMFARSVDGAQTFEDTILIGPTVSSTCYGGPLDAGQFSQPLVGRDGAVYVFWQGLFIDSLNTCDWCRAIRLNKSTDGGVTWQGGRPLICVDGYGEVDGQIDVYSQPTTDADITDGPHAGNLYLQWRDMKPVPPYDSEIMFMRSLDTGHTWSAPTRVNDDPPDVDVDQFHNWMVCNDQGILVSIWYDQRMDLSHYAFDVFAAYSFDGGATWTGNHRISSVSSSPDYLARRSPQTGKPATNSGITSPMDALSPMAGKIAEYIGVTSIGNIVAAVWTDTRDGMWGSGQDVYSARWHLPLTDPRLIYPIKGEEVDETPGLAWATAWKENEDRYRVQIDDDQEFSGPERDVFVETNSFDGWLLGLADGRYYWRIKAYKTERGAPIDSTEFSEPGSFTLRAGGCDCTDLGDANGDGILNPVDVVVMANYVYKNLASPSPIPTCPSANGDWNCDDTINPVDVVYVANYVYNNSGVEPCDPCLQ